MSVLSAQSMTRLLTKPYRRGAETLEIPLGTDSGGWTNVGSYDFSEYRARYQVDPVEPKYILFTKKETGSDGIDIEVEFFGGAIISMQIPPRTFAKTSFVIPLPPAANATLRLRRFRQLPIALVGAGADNWGIVALLGNIAKLTWVLGWEKDHIRQHLQDIQQQRQRALAHGFSLDKLGEDLRVPRFPPREHSFDANTIALYHLNALVPNNGVFTDDTTRFGLPGHPGTNKGAQSSVTGKFGAGFQFSNAGFIEIPTHSDFNIAANRSFTVEAFVNTLDESSLRAVITKGSQDTNGSLTNAGWALMVGIFARGIANNVRWSVSDGTNQFEIFADLNIADGRFLHLAGLIDRNGLRARLLVDGEERANVDISTLGAIVNSEPIRIGRSSFGHQFSGVVDEVRLSNIARPDFHPVLGESDEAYRQRLGIFEHWLLPTTGALLKTINSLVQINNQSDSFVLIEKDRPGAGASKLVRILPAALLTGQSIDREGNLHSTEAEVSGVPKDDVDFKEMYLLRHDHTQVDYRSLENNRRMQAATKRVFDLLLEMLRVATPPVIIDKSFDPGDSGLHRVGRALLLRHDTLTIPELGFFAHRAGFDFVSNQGTHVYVSVAPGEKLEIVVEPRPAAETPPAGIDVIMDKTILLHIDPESLPGSGQIKWTLIPCGAGRARFEMYEQTVLSGAVDAATTTINVTSSAGFPSSPPFKIRIDDETMSVTALAATTWTVTRGADGTTAAIHANGALVTLASRTPVTSRPHLRLIAEAPGEITLRVEYTFQRRTVIGTRTIRIGIETLGDGQTIAANGDMKLTESEIVGKPGEVLNPIYLITSNAAVNFGANANNKKMQIVLERPFNRLVEFLAATSNGLQILKTFDPANTGLHKTGRALLIRHTSLNSGRLAAIAHQAGFDFVRRQGNQVYCSVAAGEKIEVVRDSDSTPLQNELIGGSAINIRVRLGKLPVVLDGLPALLLFSIGVSFATDLNNLVISNGLRTEFVNNGITLGANPRLSIEQTALKWKIADDGIIYILKKEAGAINVYTPSNYNWSLEHIGHGRGVFDFVLRPLVKFTPREPGLVLLNITYLEQDPLSTFPYTYEIRLKSSLDVPGTIIPKHQYDLIMNILNYFHPIGVEVVTRNIREHVVEVKENLLNAFPGYTYPDYRDLKRIPQNISEQFAKGD